ncbi:MAG TPA: NRDE family protein [Thermoanaerobaculia bacterium]|nr:NRDE family protein [Thermoanaerobaculia bacterium]
MARNLPCVSYMCLIVLAHRANARFPFILAANRDEDYERPSHAADFWPDAPDVLGGRDAVHGGSWLAMAKSGRFAAVTNLRGAERRTRSRGALVRDFVTAETDARSFAESIVADAAEYSGFHLLAGQAGSEILHITPDSWIPLPAGIHAISNAPLGEQWPKTSIAAEAMEAVLRLEDVDAMVDVLMRFLTTPRNTGHVESEIFIAGERYGTRASTVIVGTEREIVFTEWGFGRGGAFAREAPLTLTLSLPR